MKTTLKTRLKLIWRVCAGYRLKIILCIVLDIVTVALSLLFVYLSKEAIDLSLHEDEGNLKLILILLVLSLVIGITLSLITKWIYENSRNVLTIRVQNYLSHSQMIMAKGKEKRMHTGDLLVRLNTDCSEVIHMIAYVFPNFVVTCFKFVASFALLWTLDSLLARLILFITPLFVFSRLYYQTMRKITKEVKKAESGVGTVMQENLKNRTLIKSLLFADARDNKLKEAQNALLKLKTRLLNFSTFRQSILRLTFDGGYMFVFVWGIYRLHEGLISYGTIIAFLQLVSRVQMPVVSMAGFLPAAIRFRTAMERLIEINRGEREDYSNPITMNTPMTLKINNLCFKYEDSEVIKNLNAEFHSGVPAAVIGASGIGKTTLIRLILGILKPDSGNMVLTLPDGTSHEISVATRNNIAYVPQGNSLFYGTIRENLVPADPDTTEEHLREVLEIACAEFVFSLPDGLDTMVGEAGDNLSEGQAQRIAVARAILHGGSIWLFDEHTSALDLDTVHQVIRNVMLAGKEKILIFVTHSHTLTEICPQIVHL